MRNAYALKHASTDDVELFQRVETCLAKVDLADVSCHDVAFAVSSVLNIRTAIRHGRFYQSWEHSWLKTPSGWIIDV